MITIQVKNGSGDFETLTISRGKIRCTCLREMFNPGRELKAECRHAKKLREDIKNAGDINKFISEYKKGNYKNYFNLLTT